MAAMLQQNPALDIHDVRDACQARLDALIAQVPSLVFASMGTVDGRSFVFSSPAEGGSPQRFAAITSSLLAMSESFAREALRSQCTHSVVATDHGTIVTVRIPCRSRAYALSVGADSSDMLAMTLRKTLDAAEALAALIDNTH